MSGRALVRLAMRMSVKTVVFAGRESESFTQLRCAQSPEEH
jgi:hypothetical protein